MKPRRLGTVLFPGFELLDTFGPLEMFGNMPGVVEVLMIGETGGAVKSGQGPSVATEYDFQSCPPLDLVLVPGGMSTRTEVDNPAMIDFLRQRGPQADVTMSVCSGAALLARAGLLDGLRATTNKMFFHEIASQSPTVEWVKEARWVDTGRYVTSSGVAAGIDMTLAVIERLYGHDIANSLAIATEIEWHRDSGWDPFAKIHGLV